MVQDQGAVCAYYESTLKVRYHVFDMVPLFKGGLNDWTDLAVTCAACNRAKGSLTTEEFFTSNVR